MKPSQSEVQAQLQVLMNLHTGVVVHAADTRILFSNKRAAQLLGLSEAQMLGKSAIDPAWHFVDAEGREIQPGQYPVSQVLASGQPLAQTDFGVVMPQRREITWLSVSAFPKHDAAGALEHVVVNFHDISARRRVEAELERSRAFARSALDSMAALVCVLDEAGVVLAVNQAWKDFHAAHGDAGDADHVGRPYLGMAGAGVTPEGGAARDEAFAGLLAQVLAGRRERFEWEYPLSSDGQRRWFVARVSRIHHAQPACVVVAHDEISAMKQAQEELRGALTFTRKLIESMQDGFSVLDSQGRATQANPALCRMTGFSSEELLGRAAPFPYWPPEEHGRIDAAFRETLDARGGDFELIFMRKNGERFPVSVAASAVRDEQGRPITFVATVKDITLLRHMEAEIERLAFHDPLTHLPNRRLFEDRLKRAQAAAVRNGWHGAMLMLDLDTFKAINDSQGHAAGDQLLVAAARRLQGCVREVDTVARFGGDEFVVVLDGLGADEAWARVAATGVAEKIRTALAQPFVLQVGEAGSERPLQWQGAASVGLAMFSARGLHAADALRQADQAMYEAKRDGGNQVRQAWAGPSNPAAPAGKLGR